MSRHKSRSLSWFAFQWIGYGTLRWTMSWLQVLGWTPAQKIGRWIGRLAYCLLPARRKIALENIRAARVTPDDPSARRLARAVFEHLGIFAAEFFLLEHVRRRGLHKTLLTVRHPERMAATLGRGRGALVSIGHLGNWEIAGLGFCDRYGRLASVYRPLDFPPLDRLVLRIRSGMGMEMIPKEGAAARLARAVLRREVAAILTDQDARTEGIFVDFFGRPASTLPTPAVLSLRFGVPVIPVNVFRQGARHVVEFDEPALPERFRDQADPVRAMMQHLTGRLEAFIRKHPEQWLWLHRRWKTRPPST